MTSTHPPLPKEAIGAARPLAHASPQGSHPAGAAARRPAPEGALAPAVWQRLLPSVRLQHPSLNRTWFDQMNPRQLTNGVIQVTVGTAAQLNFCQGQCQTPFTAAAQAITRRLLPGSLP